MTQSWDEATDRYGDIDASTYDDRIRDADQPRMERDIIDEYLDDCAPDATGVGAVAAVVVGLNSVPSTRAIAAATGTDDTTVERVRERIQHERRRATTPLDCPVSEELDRIDDPEEIAGHVRYYFEGIVDGHWLETAAVGWRDNDVSRDGLGDVLEAMLHAHDGFDLVQADQLVQLSRGLDIEEAVVNMQPREATEKAVTVLEAGLREYATRALGDESDRDAVAKLKIRFPRIAKREWGAPVIAYAAAVDVKMVRRVDVATNPGGVEVDPIRREAIERDEGECVRCSATAAVPHRLMPPEADEPARATGHACLCADCYWEAHTDSDHRRRYEDSEEFWEWAKASNTTL